MLFRSHANRNQKKAGVAILISHKIDFKMNLFTKQKQTYRHRKENYGYPKGKGRRDKLAVWA